LGTTVASRLGAADCAAMQPMGGGLDAAAVSRTIGGEEGGLTAGRGRGGTALVSTLANARRILDAATTTVDGKRAAANTARRHRTILANALDYARELGAIDAEANRSGP